MGQLRRRRANHSRDDLTLAESAAQLPEASMRILELTVAAAALAAAVLLGLMR
jgi:hypothetical protein